MSSSVFRQNRINSFSPFVHSSPPGFASIRPSIDAALRAAWTADLPTVREQRLQRAVDIHVEFVVVPAEGQFDGITRQLVAVQEQRFDRFQLSEFQRHAAIDVVACDTQEFCAVKYAKEEQCEYESMSRAMWSHAPISITTTIVSAAPYGTHPTPLTDQASSAAAPLDRSGRDPTAPASPNRPTAAATCQICCYLAAPTLATCRRLQFPAESCRTNRSGNT
mmetsp:Transcript_13354/g.36903  ORF Transcript_13354/g.36903 Transcript_13354/m.36903 type:complete len:221 (+) Transcript_13354:1044-1706(+)